MSISEPRTMPSREFLVRQSVLSAAAEVFPMSTKTGRLGHFLQYADYSPRGTDWPQSSMLFKAIPHHFRALVAQYGGTTCP